MNWGGQNSVHSPCKPLFVLVQGEGKGIFKISGLIKGREMIWIFSGSEEGGKVFKISGESRVIALMGSGEMIWIFSGSVEGKEVFKISTRHNFIDASKEHKVLIATESGDFILSNPNNLSPSLEISFQNYCLNLENTITSDPNYLPDLKLNVTERVFWKWIKELGGVRYRSANQNEVVASWLF